MCMTNRIKLLLLVAVVMLLPFSVLASSPNDQMVEPLPSPQPASDELLRMQLEAGEQALAGYLASRQMTLDRDSSDYQVFLVEVLNDIHPDLWKSEQQEAIISYAIHFLGLQPDVETREVDLQNTAIDVLEALDSSTVTSSYNRTNAVNYANNWVQSGGKKRNSVYPDFSDHGGDCTNFISQVARAGGIAMRGTGTCRHESTTTKWYVKQLAKACGLPGQSLRTWAWSTSWSTVRDFRYYMRDEESAYVEAYPANNEAVSLLISRAGTGDMIQFDVRSCSTCSWTPTHSVVVVRKDNLGGYYLNDIRYNDHSGSSNGNDTLRASLRAKYQSWADNNQTNLRRMVWIRMP